MTQSNLRQLLTFITQGTDLTKLLKEAGGGFPADLVRLIALQIGLALQHLHFKGFIHRDVKV